MIRLTWLPEGPYVLTEPTERQQSPQSKRDGVQCMCCAMRPATAEEVRLWKEGKS
jgi:hypothetical protein